MHLASFLVQDYEFSFRRLMNVFRQVTSRIRRKVSFLRKRLRKLDCFLWNVRFYHAGVSITLYGLRRGVRRLRALFVHRVNDGLHSTLPGNAAGNEEIVLLRTLTLFGRVRRGALSFASEDLSRVRTRRLARGLRFAIRSTSIDAGSVQDRS